MSSRQARFERRLADRRAEAEGAPEAIERRSVEDRRVKAMAPAEVDDWLKRNGISGGDRRKAPRRRR